MKNVTHLRMGGQNNRLNSAPLMSSLALHLMQVLIAQRTENVDQLPLNHPVERESILKILSVLDSYAVKKAG